MILNKEETIKEHRKMWNWIADETLKRRQFMSKEDYINDVMKKNSDLYTEELIHDLIKHDECFCCLYISNILGETMACPYSCPIAWPYGGSCCNELSPFNEWNDLVMTIGKRQRYMIHSQKECEYVSKLAREIANLPEREK